MDGALALTPEYAVPSLGFAGEPAQTDDVIWWVVVVGLRVRGRARVGDVVSSYGRQPGDLVRLDGVQGCLQRADVNGGRAVESALPPATASRSSRQASGSASAAPSLSRASTSMCGRARSSGSSARTAPGRRRSSMPSPGSSRSMPARSRWRGLRPARGSPARLRPLVPDDPAGLDELTVEEHIALVHALWRPGAQAAARAEALLSAFGLGPRRAATARDALARPPQASERRRRLLARTAAPPRRRGDCDARSRGRRRPRRGARDARGGRLRGAARHPGSPLRRSCL